MDLDDLASFSKLDTQNQISDILELPDHLEKAFKLAKQFPIPEYSREIRHILLCGMGESASAGELAAEYSLRDCPIPLTVLRSDDLPAWAGNRDRDTLVVASSLAGNIEATVTVYEQAILKGCPTLVITTGGRLAEIAHQAKQPIWQLDLPNKSRIWLAYLFGSLLTYLSKRGLIPDPLIDLPEAIQALRSQQARFRTEVAAVNNPAKRMAGQMVGRTVCMFATQDLVPVARRWKNQINLLAKAWAQFESVPESDHNSLFGMYHPDEALTRLIVLFLAAPSSQPNNLLRLDHTRQTFLMQGINTDFIQARGSNRLAHLWTLLQFGDYISYYLAMAYGEEPSPDEEIGIYY